MLQKFLVRFVFGTVIFLFLLAGGVRAENEQLTAFEKLLDTIESDPCTALMSKALVGEERTKKEREANAKCKGYHELLQNSPFYESEDCLKGDDPRCADTVDSWDKACHKMNRCSLSIDGTWCGTKRRSIYRCVSNSLKQHKKKKAKELERLRKARGYKPAPEPPAPEPPAPTRSTSRFPTARAPTATVNTRAPTSTTASNTGAPPKTVPAQPAPTIKTRTRPTPAQPAPTIKTRTRPTPAQPAPTKQTPATTAPAANKPNWPRQDSWKARLPPPIQWSTSGSPRFGSAGHSPIGLIGAGRPIPPPKTSPGVTVTVDPRASSAKTVTFSSDAPRVGGGYQSFQRSKTIS